MRYIIAYKFLNPSIVITVSLKKQFFCSFKFVCCFCPNRTLLSRQLTLTNMRIALKIFEKNNCTWHSFELCEQNVLKKINNNIY